MSSYPVTKQKNYPLWYHNRRGDSDGQLIHDWMYFIPYELKPEVSDKYERIYQDKQPNFRGRANKYLHSEALKHKVASEKKKSTSGESYLQKYRK